MRIRRIDAAPHGNAVVGGADGTLLINRVARDGTTWTAIAAIDPHDGMVHLHFLTGRRGVQPSRELGRLSARQWSAESVRAISQLVAQAPRSAARRLGFGGLLLDRLIRTAWTGSRRLLLTPRGYRGLLTLLVTPRARGKVPA